MSSTASRRPYGRGPPATGYVRRGSDAAKPQAPAPLRKPVFTTVDKLRPQTHGHTLVARVVSARTILDKPSPHMGRARLAECLVGDQTGTVLFTARRDQGLLLNSFILPLLLCECDSIDPSRSVHGRRSNKFIRLLLENSETA
jgi:replication factor A1